MPWAVKKLKGLEEKFEGQTRLKELTPEVSFRARTVQGNQNQRLRTHVLLIFRVGNVSGPECGL